VDNGQFAILDIQDFFMQSHQVYAYLYGTKHPVDDAFFFYFFFLLFIFDDA
jgi:hypothetical protein